MTSRAYVYLAIMSTNFDDFLAFRKICDYLQKKKKNVGTPGTYKMTVIYAKYSSRTRVRLKIL